MMPFEEVMLPAANMRWGRYRFVSMVLKVAVQERRPLSLTAAVKIEHNALEARSNVLRMETELGAHLQHARVFG